MDKETIETITALVTVVHSHIEIIDKLVSNQIKIADLMKEVVDSSLLDEARIQMLEQITENLP